MAQTDRWIAVDWGTSNARAWLYAGDRMLDQTRTDQGMGGLTPDAFEPTLMSMISPWLTDAVTPVIACGMVGAKQGWVEAPYATAPCPAPGMDTAIAAPVSDPRITVHILPGICQISPPDVMRGEETQIAGFLSRNPDFDGVLCLPGTHTKWVRISAGEIVSFQTFMTGEIFALLSENSVLRHSLGDGWDDDAFATALSDTLSRPQGMAAKLFSLRAGSLVADTAPDTGPDTAPNTARAMLSGYLLGLELAGAKPYWLGQDIVIIGTDRLATVYETALLAQGVTARCESADDITRRGLAAAYNALKDTGS